VALFRKTTCYWWHSMSLRHPVRCALMCGISLHVWTQRSLICSCTATHTATNTATRHNKHCNILQHALQHILQNSRVWSVNSAPPLHCNMYHNLHSNTPYLHCNTLCNTTGSDPQLPPRHSRTDRPVQRGWHDVNLYALLSVVCCNFVIYIHIYLSIYM